jgi:hypothetical protein
MVQRQTEQQVLTYLMAASMDEQASFAARSIVLNQLNQLRAYITNAQKANTDPIQSGHYALALERMKSPEKAKPTQHLPAPPGAPIGCEEDEDVSVR